MNVPNDPAYEIRRALDREAQRRFDADGLTAALREEPPAPRAAPSPGPLGRIPVPIQWIGIAAAVIAATTGLRTLYLDLSPRDPAPSPPDIRAAAVPPERQAEERAVPSGTEEPAAPVATKPSRPAPAPRTIEEARPEPPRTVGGTIATVLDGPSTYPSGEAVATSSPEGIRPSPPPSTSPPAPAPEKVAAKTTEPDGGQLPRFGVVVATRPEVTIGGVRSASFSVGGHRLLTSIREVPELDATLVTLLGPQSSLLGVDTEPEETPRPSPRHQPRESGKPDSASFLGGYYVRLLAGAPRDLLPQDEPRLLAESVFLEPPRDPAEADIFGSEPHKAALRNAFGLRTIVASEGVRIAPAQGTDTAIAFLRALLGRSVVSIDVRASAVNDGAEHRIEVQVSQTSRRRREVPAIEGELRVVSGRVVVLAVPNSLLLLQGPAPAWSGSPTIFLALSPRPRDPVRLRAAEQELEPPMLLDGPAPPYPEQARDRRPTGTVVLRAVVREDGSIDSVELIEAPDVPGASYLVEAAIEAARTWRYMPARRDGRPVDAYVTITMEFRSDE